MSLRQKIILLFGLFAVGPMLALAGVSYWQARNLLIGLVHEQAEEIAHSTASDLAAKGHAIESNLKALARNADRSWLNMDSSEAAPEPAVDSLLALAAYVGSRSPDGILSPILGSIPEAQSRCINGIQSRLVTFSVPVTSDPALGLAEAGFWVSDLVRDPYVDQDHPGLRVTAGDGSVLFGRGCGSVGTDSPSPDLPHRGSGSSASVEADTGEGLTENGDWERSVATVEGFGWSVVALASLTDALHPLKRLALGYWVFILVLSAATSLAFSLMLGRFTRSLSDLARAAEEIGLGELDPWLPLSTSGEIGQLTLAFSRMLERFREMMGQVDQSGRLAVVGQMSAYLAHEIRNPLSSIKLNLQRLSRWARAGRLPEYSKEPLEISLKEVDRLTAAVTGVLQLSTAEEGPREIVDLHDVLGEATDLLASRFTKQGVGMSLELDPDADLILGRPGQVKSVALNLMMNALEAQPEGGHLTIRTALFPSPDFSGPAVSIHFQDQGPGIPPRVRDRIFEPFFTTKKNGSGIGLAMAKQAVEDSGGQLLLVPSLSALDGAEFVVVFPLASVGSAEKGPDRWRTRYSTTRVLPAPVRHQMGGTRLKPEESSPRDVLTPGGRESVSSLSKGEPEGIN